MSTTSRFMSFVRVADNGCWEWAGRREKNGYGRFSLGGRMQWAHRVAFTLFKGLIPDGHDVCHHCDNRACVNPAHLFTGTRAENMADASAKGRTTIGEKSGTAKLTEADVRAIRRLYVPGVTTHRGLARMFGISYRGVALILNRERWRHV